MPFPCVWCWFTYKIQGIILLDCIFEKLLTNDGLRCLFFFKRRKNIGNNTIKEYDSIRTNIYNNFHIDIKPENFYFYYIFRYESEILKDIEHCENNKINYILFSTKTKKFYSSQKGIFKKSKLNYLSLEKNLAVPIQNKESNIELLGKKTKRDNGSDERKKWSWFFYRLDCFIII